MASTTLNVMTMFGAGALVVFVVIAYAVTHSVALTGFDARDFDRRQSTVTAAGKRMFEGLSLLGSPASMTILAVAGAVWLLWKRRGLLLASWVTAFAGANLLVVVLKRLIHRDRPVGAELFLHGPSLSFPSGHAVGAIVGFGMLTYLLSVCWINGDRYRNHLVVLATCTVALIGFSRLYLGVHYLSDVIAGLALGLAWLLSCIVVTELAYRSRVRIRT